MPRIATWESKNSIVTTNRKSGLLHLEMRPRFGMLMVTLLIIQRSVECGTDHLGEGLTKARQETTWKSCADWLPIDRAPLELKGASYTVWLRAQQA